MRVITSLLLFLTVANAVIYWGAFVPDFDKDLEPFERNAKRAISMSMSYMEMLTDLNKWYLAAVRKHGAIPIVTMELRRVTLTNIANGQHDDWIAKFAGQLKEYGGPVMIRFAHEMNGNWYPWSQVSNPPGAYVNAWRHFFDALKKNGVTTVTSVWCPNVDYPGATPLKDVWPGDNYVDWLCMDGYNYEVGGKTQYFDDIFASTITQFQALSKKPIVIGETGTPEPGITNKAQWFANFFSSIQKYPSVQAFLYFHITKQGEMERPWRIDTSQSSIDAFAAGVNNGYFTKNDFGALTATPIPPYSGAGGNPQQTNPPVLPPTPTTPATPATTTPPNNQAGAGWSVTEIQATGNSIPATGSFSVRIRYNAPVEAEIHVDILDKKTWKFYGAGISRIAAGSGTATITITVLEAIPATADIALKGWILKATDVLVQNPWTLSQSETWLAVTVATGAQQGGQANGQQGGQANGQQAGTQQVCAQVKYQSDAANNWFFEVSGPANANFQVQCADGVIVPCSPSWNKYFCDAAKIKQQCKPNRIAVVNGVSCPLGGTNQAISELPEETSLTSTTASADDKTLLASVVICGLIIIAALLTLSVMIQKRLQGL